MAFGDGDPGSTQAGGLTMTDRAVFSPPSIALMLA
jgi:hypothetical protein